MSKEILKTAMTLEELKKVVPADWLKQHRLEYIEKAEKITKLIMMSEAANKGWKKPLTDRADYAAFITAEAEDKGLSEEAVRGFLMDAGKIKARNHIFETHFLPNLPKDNDGKCVFSKKVILEFIRDTTEGR